ncbi:MAG: hypothetical protein ABIH27_02130 [Candidatus Omnitrophota bacterium]
MSQVLSKNTHVNLLRQMKIDKEKITFQAMFPLRMKLIKKNYIALVISNKPVSS